MEKSRELRLLDDEGKDTFEYQASSAPTAMTSSSSKAASPPLTLGFNNNNPHGVFSSPRSPQLDTTTTATMMAAFVTPPRVVGNPHTPVSEKDQEQYGIGSTSYRGAPQELVQQHPPQQQQQQQLQPIVSSNRNSTSTLLSSSSSPSTKLPELVETQSDLAKRHMALMQVQHELNLERWRVEEEMKIRQMEEAEQKN